MLASQSSAGNGIKKHLFWSVTCTLRRSASIRQITSWLVVLFFIDRGNARQPEALSFRSLSLLGLEGPGLRHALRQ
jgi:hypothetical protein